MSALAGFGLAASPGCGTDAKGVDECRDIESARCNAAVSCRLVPDVESCVRFYRDHCLHGMAVAPPPPDAVAACARTITYAGSCAQSSGADTEIEDCPDPDLLKAESGMLLACDIVKTPELADDCAFLSGGSQSGSEGGGGGEPASD
jgi:hypothetical protein